MHHSESKVHLHLKEVPAFSLRTVFSRICNLPRHASIWCCILVATAVSCSPTRFVSEESGWILLDEKKVNHIREKDVINIKSLSRFTALRLYVKDKNVEIKDVEIMLINGDVLRPAIETTILKGERSRIIELASEGRQLRQIKIRYKSEGNLFSKKAIVQIAGRPFNPNDKY